MMVQFAALLGFAFAVSMAVSGFMVHAGLGDEPNARSSHAQTTPTAGGVGIIAGLGGFFFLWPHLWTGHDIPTELPKLLALIGAVAGLGWIDDIFGIRTGLKFLILTGLAAAAVWIIGPVTALPFAMKPVILPYVVGFLGSILWIFVVTNAVNFMDGSNGLMPSVMIIAFIMLAVICVGLKGGTAGLIPIGFAASICGILPYNMRNRARIFTGDVGSLPVGFGFAISVLWLCAEVPETLPVFIGPVLILPFLADVLLTMFRRARHKQNLLTPHRTHLYQRLIQSGYSHLRVASIYIAATFIFGTYAVTLTGYGFHHFTAFLIGPVLGVSLIYVAVSRWLS